MEFLKVIWAHVRCEYYLLFKGMWKGECKLVGWSKVTGKISYIAATTGSIWDGTIRAQKVFLNESKIAEDN